MNLKKLFLDYCKVKQYEINLNQTRIVDDLKDFYRNNFNQSFLDKILKKKSCTFAVNIWALTLPKLPKVVLFLVKHSVLITEKATKNQKIKVLAE